MEHISAAFIAELEALLGVDRVTTDPEKLQLVSKDETHGLAPAIPDVWVEPVSTQEVAQVMALCARHSVYLTPRGAGTGKSGGCVAVEGGVVMSFTQMKRIVHIDVANLTARVEPGVVLADLQAAVEELGLFYPPDPASAPWCTIGGNIAENAGGPSALKYGVTRDYLLGMTAVLPTGEVIQVGKSTVKGVTGYDLVSMICGSEGTLALVTEATLKLLPKPAAIKTGMIMFASERGAGLAVTAILTGGILPRSIEYIDGSSIEILTNTGARFFPKNTSAALIVEVDADSDESAFDALTRVISLVQDIDVVDAIVAQDEKQRREIWDARKRLSEAIKRHKNHKISEDVVVPRARIPDLIAKLRALGEEYGLQTCAFGHAGDGNLHAQILFDDQNEMPKVERLLEDLFRATIEMGGTLTGEHGVGVAKKAYLAMEQSESVIALERRIKSAFDPKGILNPGKFLP